MPSGCSRSTSSTAAARSSFAELTADEVKARAWELNAATG
jgi:hypothetical protein